MYITSICDIHIFNAKFDIIKDENHNILHLYPTLVFSLQANFTSQTRHFYNLLKKIHHCPIFFHVFNRKH